MRRFDYSWRSDRGLVRARNEDSIAVDMNLGLVVVADGIGGANSGDVASRSAVDVVSDCIEREIFSTTGPEQIKILLEDAVSGANGTIYELSLDSPAYAGMGTTIVVGVAVEDWLVFVHVGDSRLYRLRGNRFDQLTKDHSLIQESVDRGFFPSLDEARRQGVGDNILTRALGAAGKVDPASGQVRLESGDLYLFCTDGLTGMIPDDLLCQVLSAGRDDLEQTAGKLVEMACERGGRDNITLALMRVS